METCRELCPNICLFESYGEHYPTRSLLIIMITEMLVRYRHDMEWFVHCIAIRKGIKHVIWNYMWIVNVWGRGNHWLNMEWLLYLQCVVIPCIII